MCDTDRDPGIVPSGATPSAHDAECGLSAAAVFVQSQTIHFRNKDFEKIGNMCDEPIVLVDPFGTKVYHDRTAYNANLAYVYDHFAQLGYDRSEMELLVEEPLGNELISLTVRWIYLDRAGEEIGGRISTYVVRRTEHGFRVAVHIQHTALHEQLGPRPRNAKNRKRS